jgi:hypothetical protein
LVASRIPSLKLIVCGLRVQILPRRLSAHREGSVGGHAGTTDVP